jgi:hypothetical protein
MLSFVTKTDGINVDHLSGYNDSAPYKTKIWRVNSLLEITTVFRDFSCFSLVLVNRGKFRPHKSMEQLSSTPYAVYFLWIPFVFNAITIANLVLDSFVALLHTIKITCILSGVYVTGGIIK